MSLPLFVARSVHAETGEGKPWLVVPLLNIHDVGMGAEAHKTGPHFEMGGGLQLQPTIYSLPRGEEKLGAWYGKPGVSLDLNWHEEHADDQGARLSHPHRDIFGELRISMDTVWVPAYGRVYEWGVLIVGPSFYGEWKRPFDWFNTRDGQHTDLLTHFKGSGGVGLVITGRTHEEPAVCPALADDLARVQVQAEAGGDECKNVADELRGHVANTHPTTPESLFDPNSFRLRVHVGPAGSFWLLEHNHNTSDARGHLTSEPEPDTEKTASSLLVFVDGALQAGPVNSVFEAVLFLPNEFYVKAGLSIPISKNVNLVWNVIEYQRSKIEESFPYALASHGPVFKTGFQVEIKIGSNNEPP